jgi:hypothetical protein
MENFEVWPNPFSGILHVKSESGGKYMLYDLRGGVLAKGILRGGESTIDFGALAKGVYFLACEDNGGIRQTIKLLRD